MAFVLSSPGASSSRVSVPPVSPHWQAQRGHIMQQPGLPVPAFEASLVSVASPITASTASRVMNVDGFTKPLNANVFPLDATYVRQQHGDVGGGYNAAREHSPPPAHQQATPVAAVMNPPHHLIYVFFYVVCALVELDRNLIAFDVSLNSMTNFIYL